MPSLLEEVTQDLEEAAATPLGQKAITAHDEDYEFEIPGREPFYVEMRGGKMAVHPGLSPRHGQPLAAGGVALDEPTLRDILGGRTSPYEAMAQGKLFLLIRLYGGSQITILLRAAYDLARQRALQRGLAAGSAG